MPLSTEILSCQYRPAPQAEPCVSPSLGMVGSRPGFDDNLARHGMVGNAAIFMTEEGIGAGPVEAGRDPRYLAGEQHGIDVGSAHQEPMDDVLAGRHEGDFRALRHPDLGWIEEPNTGHQMGLIPTRGDLDDTRLIEGCRLHDRGRVDPPGLPW